MGIFVDRPELSPLPLPWETGGVASGAWGERGGALLPPPPPEGSSTPIFEISSLNSLWISAWLLQFSMPVVWPGKSPVLSRQEKYPCVPKSPWPRVKKPLCSGFKKARHIRTMTDKISTYSTTAWPVWFFKKKLILFLIGRVKDKLQKS